MRNAILTICCLVTGCGDAFTSDIFLTLSNDDGGHLSDSGLSIKADDFDAGVSDSGDFLDAGDGADVRDREVASPDDSGTDRECGLGLARCVDAQRQTCVGGLWLDNGAPCSGWCIDGACVECKPGDRSCAGDTQPRTCDASGSWAFDAACDGDKPWCSEGSCMGYCCRGSAVDTRACDPDNPWHCYPDDVETDCTKPCTSGSCNVPSAFSGKVEICP